MTQRRNQGGTPVVHEFELVYHRCTTDFSPAPARNLSGAIMQTKLYGYVAEFADADALLHAAQAAQAAGYRKMNAYSPFSIEGLSEAVGMKRNVLPWIVLCGGFGGAGLGYYMMWYASVVSYPINVGGRPYHSWPAFIPITFELGILSASITAFFAVVLLSGLPRPYHPIFNAVDFDRVTQDRFVLCVRADDPQFETDGTFQFLSGTKPLRVTEVEDLV